MELDSIRRRLFFFCCPSHLRADRLLLLLRLLLFLLVVVGSVVVVLVLIISTMYQQQQRCCCLLRTSSVLIRVHWNIQIFCRISRHTLCLISFYCRESGCWQRRSALEKCLFALCLLAAIAILALVISLYFLNVHTERKPHFVIETINFFSSLNSSMFVESTKPNGIFQI